MHTYSIFISPVVDSDGLLLSSHQNPQRKFQRLLRTFSFPRGYLWQCRIFFEFTSKTHTHTHTHVYKQKIIKQIKITSHNFNK